jgi:hypothetical protein
MSDPNSWNEVGDVVDLSLVCPEGIASVQDIKGLYRLTEEGNAERSLDGRFILKPQFSFLQGVHGVQLKSKRFQPTSYGLLRSRAGEYWLVHAFYDVSSAWDFKAGNLRRAFLSVADWILDNDGDEISDFSSQKFQILGNVGDEFILAGDSPLDIQIEGEENQPKGRPIGRNCIQFADGSIGKRRFSEERDAELIFVTLPDGSEVVLAEYGRDNEIVKYFLFNRSLVMSGKDKLEAFGNR